MRRWFPALVTTVVAALMSTTAAASAEPAGCEVVFSSPAWVVDLCRTDGSIVPMEVVLNGSSRGDAALVRAYHVSSGGNFPQVAVFYSSGYVRLKPNLDPPAPPFGSQVVLGPAYWPAGGGYHHNPHLSRLELSTSGLPAALGLHGVGTVGAFSVDYQMSLPAPTDTETRLHVTQRATATAAVVFDPGRVGEHQGYKVVHSISMFLNEGGRCAGNVFDCHDANVAGYVDTQGADRQVALSTRPPASFVFPTTAAMGGRALDLLHTDDQSWQGDTPSLRVLLDAPPIGVTPQGWIADTGDDPTRDNVEIWAQDDVRAAQGFTTGQVHEIGYTAIAFEAPFPAVGGATWYRDGTAARSGPAGTVVTAYATGLARGSAFQLVSGRPGGPDHPCSLDVVVLNPAVRTSNNLGFVGFTLGAVNRGPGRWQICFREVGPGREGATAGAAVAFTVVP